MDFLKLTTKRSSVRDFTSEPVEQEKIECILEAARMSPSASNLQPWVFVVIREEPGRKKLQSCYDRDWFKTAPVYIVVCGDHSQSWKRKDGKDYCNIDSAIAAEHICLAATALGLGSCWVCNFDLRKCKEEFGLPEHLEPVVFIPIGYPKDQSVFENKNRKRNPLSEIVKWDKF
ncbi:MAG: nitroreductase family protein [Candidatus Azobacteroides sp.]|nr:nitroreductase family protein [Candidatus Azobacteroides sp.]